MPENDLLARVLRRPSQVEELRLETHSELERKSWQALHNMHDYCQFRISQLKEHRQNLNFLAEDEFELTNLFRFAGRLERVGANFRKFSQKRSRIEQELMRRGLKEGCIVEDATSK